MEEGVSNERSAVVVYKTEMTRGIEILMVEVFVKINPTDPFILV